MINLSSELFKIETGRFELHAVPVDLCDILRRIVEMNRLTYASKELNILLTVEALNSGISHAQADAMLCYSIFQNLLKNACEAAPAGTTVSIKVDDLTALRIVIENNGAVPEEIRERFFEKFVTIGKQGGTGLGTYSAKLLTVAQNGTIEMGVSDENNSTTVTVLLPLAKSK
jgi:signal transduction histidine kinase